MTRVPDFDELVGRDLPAAERERLRRVHELIVEAGPPPELAPELEAGPSLAMTFGKRERHKRHRVALLAAAVISVLLVFLGGYVVGNSRTGGDAPANVMTLTGTEIAPDGLASLRIDHADAAGNWPMELTVTGLPKLPQHAYYVVFLVRDGKPWAPCGAFNVAGTKRGTTVRITAPYELQKGDTWAVMEQMPHANAPGPAVLTPTT